MFPQLKERLLTESDFVQVEERIPPAQPQPQTESHRIQYQQRAKKIFSSHNDAQQYDDKAIYQKMRSNTSMLEPNQFQILSVEVPRRKLTVASSAVDYASQQLLRDSAVRHSQDFGHNALGMESFSNLLQKNKQTKQLAQDCAQNMALAATTSASAADATTAEDSEALTQIYKDKKKFLALIPFNQRQSLPDTNKAQGDTIERAPMKVTETSASHAPTVSVANFPLYASMLTQHDHLKRLKQLSRCNKSLRRLLFGDPDLEDTNTMTQNATGAAVQNTNRSISQKQTTQFQQTPVQKESNVIRSLIERIDYNRIQPNVAQKPITNGLLKGQNKVVSSALRFQQALVTRNNNKQSSAAHGTSFSPQQKMQNPYSRFGSQLIFSQELQQNIATTIGVRQLQTKERYVDGGQVKQLIKQQPERLKDELDRYIHEHQGRLQMYSLSRNERSVSYQYEIQQQKSKFQQPRALDSSKFGLSPDRRDGAETPSAKLQSNNAHPKRISKFYSIEKHNSLVTKLLQSHKNQQMPLQVSQKQQLIQQANQKNGYLSNFVNEKIVPSYPEGLEKLQRSVPLYESQHLSADLNDLYNKNNLHVSEKANGLQKKSNGFGSLRGWETNTRYGMSFDQII